MSNLDVVGSLRWRIGWPKDYVIYAISVKEGGDIVVGLFRDPQVAAYVVQEHNEALAKSAAGG